MPATKQPPSNDVDYNRSVLAYSESTRSKPSWLVKSLKVKNGTTSANDSPHQEEIEQEIDVEGDDEEGGIGCVAPKAQLDQDRQSFSANERLRRQLLGKNANIRNKKEKTDKYKSDTLSASKPRPQAAKLNLQSRDDDVEGRTAVTSKKKVSSSNSHQPNNNQHDVKTGSKKRTSTYLDEILAQRQSKKSKSQKNTNESKTNNI